MSIAEVNISAVANDATLTLTNVLGDAVSTTIAREFKYCKAQGKEDAHGRFVGTLKYDVMWLRDVQERTACLYVLSDVLAKAGMVDQDGRAMWFRPITLPFHLNAAGEPVSQIRIFFYGKKKEGEKYPTSTVMVRLEPYGMEAKFDTDSAYAKPAAAEPTVEA